MFFLSISRQISGLESKNRRRYGNWLGYLLGDRWILLFPAELRDLSVLRNSHSGSVAQLTSYSMVIRGNFPGVQVAEAYS